MKAIKTILIIGAAILCLNSCKKTVDLTPVQKTYFENADIQSIEIDDAWQVTIVADTLDTFVEVEYSAYMENYVSVTMEGTELEIGFTNSFYKEIGSVFKATIHTSSIHSIKANDASQLYFDGALTSTHDTVTIELEDESLCSGMQIDAENVVVSVENGSQFLGFEINSTNCTVSANETSICKGNFETSHRFVANLSDASQLVTFGGSASNGSITLKDASTLNMAKTEVDAMIVLLSEASEATVKVTETISGSLTDASTLYYFGHPQLDVACSEDSQLIRL